MTADPQCQMGEAHCVTCSDEAALMRVVELSADGAVCADAQRARHNVAVDLVEPVTPGDQLLVHAGVAIRQLA